MWVSRRLRQEIKDELEEFRRIDKRMNQIVQEQADLWNAIQQVVQTQMTYFELTQRMTAGLKEEIDDLTCPSGELQ